MLVAGMRVFHFHNMFFNRHRDELHQFLEWRRQTRFLRHYGGPILALMLFGVCAWYVWSAATRQPRIDEQQRRQQKQLWQDSPALRR